MWRLRLTSVTIAFVTFDVSHRRVCHPDWRYKVTTFSRCVDGLWQALEVIGSYWWLLVEKRAKNLHKSQKISIFVAWKRCINTNWQKPLEWAQILSVAGSMRIVVNLHVLAWRDEAKCCHPEQCSGCAMNTALICRGTRGTTGTHKKETNEVSYII